jgi:uncharacterized RDD family membrane protein YckC
MPASDWKQEVNQRLAAHKSRTGLSTAESAAPPQTQVAASSRAAQAAARVAARYAQAPSYSQMQAAEARAALRTAELATQAALDANVAAQAALAGFEAASANSFQQEQAAAPALAPEPLQTQAVRGAVVAGPAAAPAQADVERTPQAPPQNSFQAPIQVPESETPPTRQGTDFALRPPDAPRAQQSAESFAPSAENRWEQPPSSRELWGSEAEAIEPVEPDLPIHANLIEFPRELVATRKIRPRLAEGAYADVDAERQLSIFEVDPGAISTEPEAAKEASAPAAPACSNPEWPRPDWSSIELEAQPTVEESAPQNAMVKSSVLRPAPVGYRLMAALVDGALITSVFLATVLLAMDRMQHLPAAKTAELGAALALLLVALLYQALSLLLAGATPGMSYARISLCTFDGQVPTRAQLLHRLGALLLSVLPVGLGVAWILFDDDHLSWHDQLSRTYPRRS